MQSNREQNRRDFEYAARMLDACRDNGFKNARILYAKQGDREIGTRDTGGVAVDGPSATHALAKGPRLGKIR